MQEEKERQQKMKESSQQVEPEPGESSKGGTSTSTLKLKTNKGRKIEVVRMETSEQTERTSKGQAEKARDKSAVKME